MSELVNYCIDLLKEQTDSQSQAASNYEISDHVDLILNSIVELSKELPEISVDQCEKLQLAALFANYGISSTDSIHEIISELNYPESKSREISDLIKTQRMNFTPEGIIEKVLWDATASYMRNPKFLSNAISCLYNMQDTALELPIDQWIREFTDLQDKESFYTEYAIENFSKGKKKCMKLLRKLSDMNNDNMDTVRLCIQEEITKKKDNNKKRSNLPEKGVETFFRVALPNHISLSQIADNKANTIISVNAIIISIVLSALFPNFSVNQGFFVPAIVLLSLCVITIVLAMLATLPRTTNGIVTREDVINKKGNLGFFGNFHHMKQDDFEWGIGELMKDKDYLYKSLTRDLFFQGKVLHKKYNFLRIAYFAFVFNLIVSISLFIIYFKVVV